MSIKNLVSKLFGKSPAVDESQVKYTADYLMATMLLKEGFDHTFNCQVTVYQDGKRLGVLDSLHTLHYHKEIAIVELPKVDANNPFKGSTMRFDFTGSKFEDRASPSGQVVRYRNDARLNSVETFDGLLLFCMVFFYEDDNKVQHQKTFVYNAGKVL